MMKKKSKDQIIADQREFIDQMHERSFESHKKHSAEAEELRAGLDLAIEYFELYFGLNMPGEPLEKLKALVRRVPCSDCGIGCDKRTQNWCWTDEHTRAHNGLCCDCFDQKLGMPEDKRLIPRPSKG